MFRSLVFLVGASLLGAFLAAVYYAPESSELRVNSSAYNPSVGEIRQDTVHASLPGAPILYEIEVLAGTIDVYVMEREWAASTAGGGDIRLDEPFSYIADLSATHVNGSYSFTIESDGKTAYVVVFDNSDNFYAGDAGEDAENATTARVKTTVRFFAEEDQSLTFGYLAAIPSVLLVLVTFGRQVWRWNKERHE